MTAPSELGALGGGIALFLTTALLAAGSMAHGWPSHGTAGSEPGGTGAPGALVLRATLSQARVLRDGPGDLLLHVRLASGETLGDLPIDLAVALDVSEKTSGEALGLMSSAVLEISRQLGPQDRLVVVSFADEARTILTPEKQNLEALVPGKGTNVSAGVELAASELRALGRPGAATPGGWGEPVAPPKRILLVTSGRPDRGLATQGELAGLAARLAREGISISTLGLGLGYDAACSKALSDAGGGGYYHVDDASRLAGIFAADLGSLRKLLARNVRVKLVPAPGAALVDVVEWATAATEHGEDVLVGDFTSGRSAKVVAQLRAPASSRASAADLVSLVLTGEDARTGHPFELGPVRLGVEVSDSRAAVLASAAHEIEPDLDDARVALALRGARDRARARDVDGTRAALDELRRLRPTLAYRAADGKLETKTVDELEASLLWFAARDGGSGTSGLASALSGLGFAQPWKAGNESSAVGALKTLCTSEAIFREGDKSGDGKLDYGTLAQLDKTKLVDSVIGSGTKQGYVFDAQPSTTTSEFLWFATASPQLPGTTGDRYFFTNQAGVIFYSTAPFEVDPETCMPKSTRWDAEADKFVEAMVIPTGK